MREWAKWVSKPVNGASEQSEQCERMNVASDRVALSKLDRLWLETPPETEKNEETIQKSQEQEGDGEERIGWERETNLPKSKIAEIFIAKTRWWNVDRIKETCIQGQKRHLFQCEAVPRVSLSDLIIADYGPVTSWGSCCYGSDGKMMLLFTVHCLVCQIAKSWMSPYRPNWWYVSISAPV